MKLQLFKQQFLELLLNHSEILIFTELDEAMIVKFAELGLKFGDDLRRLAPSSPSAARAGRPPAQR